MVIRAINVAIFLTVISTNAGATTAGEWSKITETLDKIPSASGMSVMQRIERCGIHIQRSASWIDVRTADLSTFNARAGDTVLQIIFDIPPLPGDSPALYKDLSATWVISRGKPEPQSGWAEQLQSKPEPIGSEVWMNC